MERERSAAAAMLGMAGFVVLAVSDHDGELEQAIETTADPVGCPECGAVAECHDRRPVWVRDLPAGGRPVTLVWVKRVWRCPRVLCGKRTWTEASEAIRPRASLTERARAEICRRVGEDGASVAAVAREFGVGWRTAMGAVREHGRPRVDELSRLDGVVAVGVDETVFSPARATSFVTGIVDLTRGRGPARLLDVVADRGASALLSWMHPLLVIPGSCSGCSRQRLEEAPVSGAYEGKQFVGMDLHRRRSVLVRTTESGEHLETIRISNDPDYLRQVITRAGEAPEVVLEATYGWYWAVDTLGNAGALVHLAHPLGVRAFEYRRVKNDERDARDLADPLRMGRLPEAWIAPPKTRELRELVRHRAKLVSIRSRCKAEVHAVLAKHGLQVSMSDLSGVAGREVLDRAVVPAPYRARIDSLLRVMEHLEFEIELFAGLARARLAADPGYTAPRTIPGIGPILAAVFVAEIGDVHRFASPEKLASWCGMTPRHHESDTHVQRGRITKQGSRLARWAAVESVQTLPKSTIVGAMRDRIADRRGRNIGVVAAARKQMGYVYYALRDHHVRALRTPHPTCAA